MQEIDLKIKGLYTHPNQFSEVPEGALSVADNIVIDRESVAEVRRGFNTYGNQLTVSGSISQLFEYQNRMLVHYDDKLAYDSDGAGTWTNYSGTFAVPESGYKVRGFKGNSNFYITTAAGIQKIDSLTSTPIDAGAPRALDGSASVTGASGFLANNKQVAYRMVWGYYDANNNLVLGSPSQRVIVSNTSGGTRDVSLTFTIPSTITTSWFYQIYRSSQTDTSVEPNDEMYLVVEDYPTAGEITAKSFTLTDSIDDTLRGATLYTSPSQEGILSANEQPPYAKDVTTYKNFYMFANTKTKHRLYLTVISVGGSSGIAINDTVTIAGTTYTGKAAETAASGEFLVYTGGTPSQNIDTTARSLVRVINTYATNTSVYAYYLPGYDELPGEILIEERDLGGSVFYATGSNGGAFSPSLPTSGTTVASDNETKTNRVYVSKVDQPEAVPTTNYVDVGTAEYPIERILALRESVFVFKRDGIYRITGTTFETFDVSLFDNTASIKARESAAVFNNQVFVFTDQGVVAVSDGGTAVVSRPIENTIIKLISDAYTNFSTATFGIGYESDRKYILFTVETTTDTVASVAYVYNAFTGGWTRWLMERTCGLVLQNDGRLYFGGTNDYVYRERKDYASSDYADDQYSVTIVSSSGTTVTLASTVDVATGMTLKQGSIESVVQSIDSGTDITVADSRSWSAGAASVYQPIAAAIQWTPQYAQNTGMLKQFQECTFLFDTTSFETVTATFSGSITTSGSSVDLTSPIEAGWGAFPWGGIPWGGGVGYSQSIRTYIPRDQQRGHWLNIKLSLNEAFRLFGLAGVSIKFRYMDTRFK